MKTKNENQSLGQAIVGLLAVLTIVLCFMVLIGRYTLGENLNLSGFILQFTYFSVGFMEVLIAWIIFKLVVKVKQYNKWV